MREIIFYKTQNGACPVEKFLDSLAAKQAQKVTWVLSLVEMIDMVPIQYFKKLEGTADIWEVRIGFGSNTFRLLGFMNRGNLGILTNGFAKKTQKHQRQRSVLANSGKKII